MCWQSLSIAADYFFHTNQYLAVYFRRLSLTFAARAPLFAAAKKFALRSIKRFCNNWFLCPLRRLPFCIFIKCIHESFALPNLNFLRRINFGPRIEAKTLYFVSKVPVFEGVLFLRIISRRISLKERRNMS
jgi:hypothetical protein